MIDTRLGNCHTKVAPRISVLSENWITESANLTEVRPDMVLPCDASAERGDATVSRLSVCLSVTLRYDFHTGWNTLK